MITDRTKMNLLAGLCLLCIVGVVLAACDSGTSNSLGATSTTSAAAS